MESAICNLCEANEFEVIIQEQYTIKINNQQKSYPANTVICKNCGHIFNTPILDKNEIKDLYSFTDRQNFSGGEFSKRKQNLYNRDIEFITNEIGIGAERNVLDVGCYSGLFLNMISEKNWIPYGIEPHKESVQVAKEKFRNLEIYSGMFEDYYPSNNIRFSLIIFGSFLEHVKNPTQILLKANSLIESSGYLFIRVPNAVYENFESIGHFFSIEHVNMYSPYLLRLFLEKTGFKVIKFSSQKNSSHILCLAQKNKTINKNLNLSYSDSNLYETISKKLQNIVKNFNDERIRINNLLNELHSLGKNRIAIYGAGTHTELLLKYTELNETTLKYLIDSNPEKQNTTIFGYQVKSPNEIQSLDIDAIVISSRAFQDDIYNSIKDCGVKVIKLYN